MQKLHQTKSVSDPAAANTGLFIGIAIVALLGIAIAGPIADMAEDFATAHPTYAWASGLVVIGFLIAIVVYVFKKLDD